MAEVVGAREVRTPSNWNGQLALHIDNEKREQQRILRGAEGLTPR